MNRSVILTVSARSKDKPSLARTAFANAALCLLGFSLVVANVHTLAAQEAEDDPMARAVDALREMDAEPAAKDASSAGDDLDPWAGSKGWPGSDEVAKKSDRAWWDQEKTDWPQWERGILRVGGFITEFDTSVKFSFNGAAGISLDAEELLGLDSNLGVFRADGLWRFGKRKRNTVDFTYASYNRDATGVATNPIDLGNGVVIPAGARMQTVFNFDIIRGTYTYAFFQDERFNVAAGFGVYVAPIEYGLLITPANPNIDPFGLDQTDATLPLPAFALRGQYRITPRFYMFTDLDFMYLKIGDFQGSLIDLRIGLEYQIWRYFGIGLGYNMLNIQVSSTQSTDYIGDFVGDIDVGFGGLMLFGKFSF